MKALVLSGGGSNGDWQAGRLAKWLESNTPDIILGCSVGALNGILAATGKPLDVWKHLDEDDIIRQRSATSIASNYIGHKMGVARPFLGFNSNSPLHETIREYVLGRKIHIPYQCSVVIFSEDQPVRYMKYQIAKGDRVSETDIKYILASTAIPVYFDPVRINEYLCVDGGLLHQTPITQAVHIGVDEMCVILCQNPDWQVKRDPPRDLVEMAMMCVDILVDQSFKKDLDTMQKLNKAMQFIPPADRPYRYIETEILFPESRIGSSRDFSNEKFRRNFEMGYQA